MGLDMYLSAEKYIHDFNFNPGEPTDAERVQKVLQAAGFDVPKPVQYIRMEVAYWRKANAIHQWFVDFVQKGVDDCGTYYVDRPSLGILRDKTAAELSAYEDNPAKAGKILPTQEGFFFGSTEIDEWYKADLELTLKQLDEALALPEDWAFYYTSSW